MKPLQFIDILDTNKHIVLYYENEEFSRKIQYRFIRNGLKKGDTCIYATHDGNISLIENDMKNNGIEVEIYTKRGLLKIFKIPKFMEYSEDIVKSAQEVIDKVLSDVQTPFRLVMRIIDKVYTIEQIEANLTLEQKYHTKFDKFNGLLLCPYDVSKNAINTSGKWVEIILQNHDSTIFASGTEEEGIAFDNA
jgi:KaiC/GvpD/RAD55 family RecA-like ATPase